MRTKRPVAAVRDAPAVVARTLRFGAVTTYEPLLLYRRGSVRTWALCSPTGQRRSGDRRRGHLAASAIAPSPSYAAGRAVAREAGCAATAPCCRLRTTTKAARRKVRYSVRRHSGVASRPPPP